VDLDLRTPIGLMFALAGAILTAFGLRTNGNEALYVRSLGINVNLWWGLVLVAFGLTMFLFGQRGQMREEKKKASQRVSKSAS
jgi:sulfite exporter TauE/SafE